MKTLTLDVNQKVYTTDRFFSNSTEQVKFAGLPMGSTGEGIRLYIVNPAGVVCAYATNFQMSEGYIQGPLTMETVQMETALATVQTGRTVLLSATITDAQKTLASGFIQVTKAPRIGTPINIGAATIAEIAEALNEIGNAEEPDNASEQWAKFADLAKVTAEKLSR